MHGDEIASFLTMTNFLIFRNICFYSQITVISTIGNKLNARFFVSLYKEPEVRKDWKVRKINE